MTRKATLHRLRIPISGDFDAAVLRFVSILRELPGFVALTGSGSHPESRFSILAACPMIERVIPSGVKPGSTDPWAALRELADGPNVVGADDLPFVGGVIAHLAYDLRLSVERLQDRHARADDPPLMIARRFGAALILDRQEGCGWLVGVANSGDTALDRASAEARERMFAAINQPLPSVKGGILATPTSPRFLMSRSEYLDAVSTVMKHLHAGDVYQVNLTYPVEGQIAGGIDGFFGRLVRSNPAPFGGLFQLGPSSWIVSASPERFVRVDGRSVITRPIKGTARRGETPAQDKALSDALVASVKDRAELAMITDLLRNDLARSCESGSVAVIAARTLESFATVHHLVATVTGRLRSSCDTVDVLKGAWPGGSISGVPKVRALDIIDQVEVARRGFYTGSLGYLSWNGRSDWNLLIRSARVEGDTALTWVGGGITVLSDPGQEWIETLHKLRGIAAAAPWSLPEVVS